MQPFRCVSLDMCEIFTAMVSESQHGPHVFFNVFMPSHICAVCLVSRKLLSTDKQKLTRKLIRNVSHVFYQIF